MVIEYNKEFRIFSKNANNHLSKLVMQNVIFQTRNGKAANIKIKTNHL